MEKLSKYGYDPSLARTVTIETGKGMPHTIISNLQNSRRDARVAVESGKWSSSLQEELSYIVSDFKAVGFSDTTVSNVLECKRFKTRRIVNLANLISPLSSRQGKYLK
ncbi:MAG: hypothetical protein II838_13745 [Lachnospiraceae bacterium]|nr:hypothetical protein [Lachnospiraceae bacterium]